ncbi:MAG TPA: GNAT family N-acetyltransferase [Clostridia bacterium]|nr:GNAT family N-acetyltransferase [Clostridia bacterium]
MQIVDFTEKQIEQAILIGRQNYDAEREYAAVLPPVDIWPDMCGFAENGLGVAAFEGERMLGFLCCYPPFNNAFQSTDATGVFSPIHGNGAIAEGKGEIYARMYQAAAEKWVKAKASSHAVSLYAHDTVAQEQFFRYGFGIRCMDAIRPMEEIRPMVETIPQNCPQDCSQYTFRELTPDEFILAYPLYAMLGEHMACSPSFMVHSHSQETFYDSITDESRFFAALNGNKIIAFLRIANSGETFITDASDLRYVDGAYCLPEYRGTGIYKSLLNFVIGTLRKEGFKRFGVDFESINPTAYRFWSKYFSIYTHSVVRRVDEYCIRQLE